MPKTKLRIKIWENKLGCTVTYGKLVLECWAHGGTTRLVGDQRSHHTTLHVEGGWGERAYAAIRSWEQEQHLWRECE